MAEGANQSAGDAWGDGIAPERQEWLEQRLHAWEQEADHGQGKGPFDGVALTGADVFWLAARALARTSEVWAVVNRMDLLRQAGNNVAFRYVIELSDLTLSGADLRMANISGAILNSANLSGANLSGANLSGAFLSSANLSRADLGGTDLSRAFLFAAVFSEANLAGANLSGADLSKADLSGADLVEGNLSGCNLLGATLDGADLRQARLSVETSLARTTLSTTTLLADVVWNSAPLARVAWKSLPVLGDEVQARKPRGEEGEWKDATTRVEEYEDAMRAYRLLAVALHSQGLNEHADYYAYRAHLMRRVVLRRQIFLRPNGQQVGLAQPIRKLAGYLAAGMLDLIAGYGYRPLRTLFWYMVVIGGFAFAYYALGPSAGIALPPLGAVVFSVTSFHGRGFFPGGSPGHSVTLDDPLTVLAAAEAVLGLFIEVSFIATFTQRYFGK